MRLRKVEQAERALRTLGVTGNLRVRFHDATARLEMDVDQLDYWSARDRRGAVRDAVLAAGFERVVMDLRGFRSGSLNALVRGERMDPRVLDLTETH